MREGFRSWQGLEETGGWNLSVVLRVVSPIRCETTYRYLLSQLFVRGVLDVPLSKCILPDQSSFVEDSRNSGHLQS